MNTFYDVELYDPETDTRGFIVIDRLVNGLSAGGIRMIPNVTKEDALHQAEVTTYQYALANIPLGGASAVIIGNPHSPDKLIKLRVFAEMAKPFLSGLVTFYEDFGIDARQLAWMYESCQSTSLNVFAQKYGTEIPSILASRPDELVKRLSDIGFVESVKEAATLLGISFQHAPAAVHETDTSHPIAVFREEQVRAWNRSAELPASLGLVSMDILILAEGSQTITKKLASKITSKLIVEGFTQAVSFDADETLFEKGTVVLPDFIVQSGPAIGMGLLLTGQSDLHTLSLDSATKVRNAVKSIVEQSLEQGETARLIALALSTANLNRILTQDRNGKSTSDHTFSSI